MTARLMIGDVRARIKEIPDGSVDLICTSPPFLALRKYGDNPESEMGSEATPAAFIDALLELTAEFRRVLAPHGSIAVELGDTFSGSGGAGGDYNEDGLRAGQAKFDGSGKRRTRTNNLYNTSTRYSDDWNKGNTAGKSMEGIPMNGGPGWPKAKSLCLTPFAYPMALAYGHNPISGQPSPAGQWMVRNMIAWARPNPPVGDLADKVRPGTSYITVATTSPRRWFDLDAVREPGATQGREPGGLNGNKKGRGVPGVRSWADTFEAHPAGAPPLDWWDDDYNPADPVDAYTLGHMTLIQATQPYKGSHFAVWPAKLVQRLILMMCPPKVCTICGVPSERITSDRDRFSFQPALAAHIKERRKLLGITSDEINAWFGYKEIAKNWERTDSFGAAVPNPRDWPVLKERLGLSDEFDHLVMGERRWVESHVSYLAADGEAVIDKRTAFDRGGKRDDGSRSKASRIAPDRWTDCGHDSWRQGCVLDPFAGSGTTLAVATGCGRDAIGVELYEENAHLVRERVGMFLEEVA